MVTAKQVPIEVRNAISAARKRGASSAEIAAAAINAWPGMSQHDARTWSVMMPDVPLIVLPLPQEARDDA